MEKKAIGRELESVASLFISSGEPDKASVKERFELKENSADLEELDFEKEFSEFNKNSVDPESLGFEVEETVKVRKRIAYPETEKVQENIKKCLFQYVQEDYIITRVELKKETYAHELNNRKVTQEEVIISLKNSSPS